MILATVPLFVALLGSGPAPLRYINQAGPADGRQPVKPTPRGRGRHGILVLLVLAAALVAGCTGGGGAPAVVDTAVAWITGLVTKSRGEPIANASVTLEEDGARSTTDGQGRFALSTTRRGPVTLRAEAADYLMLRWPVDVPSGGISGLSLRLVTMADYSQPLFEALATAEIGATWRWAAGSAGARLSAIEHPHR